MGEFIFATTATFCVLLIGAMFWFGPDIMEWVEGQPREPRVPS